jgi:hypothetical protein
MNDMEMQQRILVDLEGLWKSNYMLHHYKGGFYIELSKFATMHCMYIVFNVLEISI